ncbi:threonine/serine exporter family protein [Luteimonas sp. RIT-PG2_3]
MPVTTSYAARIAFVVELAEHLHAYGTTAQRLEGAIISVAGRLGIDCEPWCNPTGMILTFSDPERPPGDSDTTRVIRVPPGDTDLHKLCAADRIAEDVVAGTLGLSDGYAALRALERKPRWRGKLQQVLAFGLAGASVAGLLRLPWLEIATAGVIGLLVGVLDLFAQRRPRLKEAGEAIAAAMAATVTVAVAAFVAPLNLNTVIIASLIVLMPGMALTNAFSEITSQHLVSGTARISGAMSTLLKLTVGVMIALTLAQLLGVEPQVRASRPQPDWVEWLAMVSAAYAFAVLFRADRRDYLLVMLAAMTGYSVARVAGEQWGSVVGVFMSALITTVAGNGYARWFNRPGAVIRVPGIIMLVPGSTSMRSLLSSIQQQDMQAGQEAAIAVMNILLALIAGLLIGNLLLPARRNL